MQKCIWSEYIQITNFKQLQMTEIVHIKLNCRKTEIDSGDIRQHILCDPTSWHNLD